ncbi:MAG: hypothetical protein K9K67_08175 [Bacteriovoracaceae bacterium]|nr:hypothetical protein [Bacteriovoracaceae bacterium]
MKFLKKLFILTICHSLILSVANNFLQNGYYQTNRISKFEIKASFFIDRSHAQTDALVSKAKSNNSNFSNYYLPSLVMIGIGVMAVSMIPILKRKSVDFYAFLVGAIIYFASVVTSWASEKKKFEELPNSIDKNTQIETLKAQKSSYEEVLKMVDRRLMLQGAASAAFLGAGALAGIAYSKEKAQLSSSQERMTRMINEVRSKCASMPELNVVPPLLDANTQVPMRVVCERQAAHLSQCLLKAQGAQTRIAQINEAVRSPSNSEGLEAKNQQQIEISSGALMGCLGTNVPRRVQQGPGVFSVYDPKLIPKLDIKFKELGIDLDPHELISRSLPPTPRIDLSDFSIWLNLLFPTANAQVTSSAFKGFLAYDSSPESILEQLNLTEDEAMLMCQSDERIRQCNQEEVQYFMQMREAVVSAASVPGGMLIDAGTTRLVVGGTELIGRQAVAQQVTRVVATNVARHAVIVSGAAALGAGAVTVVSFVSGGFLILGIGMAAWQAYEAYDAYTKTSAYQEGRERRQDARERCRAAGKMRQYSRTGNCSASNDFNKQIKPKEFLEKIVDVLLPEAFAVVPGISNAAGEVLDQVMTEAEEETDRWMFNPKGRMILYGAISVITGFITFNTNKMKSQLQEDIKEIQNIIDNQEELGTNSVEFEKAREVDIEGSEVKEKIPVLNNDTIPVNPDQSSFYPSGYKGLDRILGAIITESFAANNPIGQLPREIPCLAPMRGKCLSSKKFIKRAMIPGVKYTKVNTSFLTSITKMGDTLQNRDTLGPEFLEEAQRLNSLKPSLEKEFLLTKKIINLQKAKKYKEEPIQFEKYEKSLINKFYEIANNASKKVSGKIELASLFGPKPRSSASFNHYIDQKIQDFPEGLNIGIGKGKGREVQDNLNIKEAEKIEFSKGLESNMNNNKNFGLNPDKNTNIFEQISKRYLIWQSKE